MEFVRPKFNYFFISKTYSIDGCEMTNVFNMLDHLLTNMIYAVICIQTWRAVQPD